MGGSRKAGLGFILVTLFLDILGIGVVVPVLPRLVASFVGDDPVLGSRLVGYLSATYSLMQFAFAPLLGSLSDRFGRRPVLLVSLVGSTVGYAMLALAPSISWFFAGRVVAGICGASIGAASAYIADISPPEKRAQNFGLIGMAFGLGFIAGPTMGGMLGHSNLRWPFALAAALSLANALYGLLVLPESLPAALRRPFSLARSNPFATLKELFRHKVVLGLAASLFFVALAQRGLESVWVLYTMHRYDWSMRQTGFSLAYVGLSAAAVQGGLVRRVIPAWGERRAMLVGLVVAIAIFPLYGLATQGWMLYALLTVGSLGGLIEPSAQGLLSRAVPADEQGMLQGGLSSLRSITSTLGPLLATSLFSYFISPAAPLEVPGASFFAGAGLLMIALLVALWTFAKAPVARPHAPVLASEPGRSEG